METLNTLRLSRASDRETLATSLTTLATSHGCAVERFTFGREICLTFRLKGVQDCIGIDGDSRLDTPLVSWVAPYGVGQCFSRAFTVSVGDAPHPRPHHKATSCPSDLDSLYMDLDEGLAMVAADEAVLFYVQPWAGETAWIAAGSPDHKEAWIEHYRATGRSLDKETTDALA